jgi:methylenetetrahydrofolate dehydrogenase (NADP+)/methenyltetrahydrofolate cyclohydrolase
MGKVLDGKALADRLNSELKKKINLDYQRIGIRPKLVAILVGDDPASKVYINIKRKTCAEIGIDSTLVNLNKEVTNAELFTKINDLNNDTTVHGIILQLPLPEKFKPFTLEFIEKIDPLKDVDGLHPINKGKLFDYDEEIIPATPKGIITLLESYNIELKGKYVVIINRSNLVGKPLIFMFLKRNATVTICHTSTSDIESHIKKADILVVAIGQPDFITKDKIKEGVVIIDVGTSRINGKIRGDVKFEDVIDMCSWITPNPGGVGPMTVSFLLQNTYNAYKRQIRE